MVGFATVRNTRRLGYGIGAGIIAGAMYAAIAGLALEFGYATNPFTTDDSNLGSHFLHGTFFMVFTFAVGFIPSAILAAIGGIAAKTLKRRKP